NTKTSWETKVRGFSVALLGLAIACAAGCAERRSRAVPWATAGLDHPKPPPTKAKPTTQITAIAPPIHLQPPAGAGRLLIAHPVPPRPRVPVPTTENGGGAKMNLLVPELSPEETTQAKEQFQQSVAAAERNIVNAKKHNLNAAQAETISKINAFLS